MNDEKQEVINDSVQQPKFVAVIKTDDGGIAFNLNGVEVEEAYLMIMKGRFMFEKLYEQYIREQVNR